MSEYIQAASRRQSASLTHGAQLVGRIMLSLVFILSGISKILAPAMTIAYIQAAGLPAPSAAFCVAVVIELMGGSLLLLGLWTRPVALALAVFSVAAALGFHHNFADQNQFVHFMKNIAIAGGMIYVAALGAGRVSLDARLGHAS